MHYHQLAPCRTHPTSPYQFAPFALAKVLCVLIIISSILNLYRILFFYILRARFVITDYQDLTFFIINLQSYAGSCTKDKKVNVPRN